MNFDFFAVPKAFICPFTSSICCWCRAKLSNLIVKSLILMKPHLVSCPQVGIFQQGLISSSFDRRAKSLPSQSFWRKNPCSVSPTLLFHFELYWIFLFLQICRRCFNFLPSISSTFYACVFVWNFSAKNFKTKTQFCNFWSQNFVQKMFILKTDGIDSYCQFNQHF